LGFERDPNIFLRVSSRRLYARKLLLLALNLKLVESSLNILRISLTLSLRWDHVLHIAFTRSSHSIVEVWLMMSWEVWA